MRDAKVSALPRARLHILTIGRFCLLTSSSCSSALQRRPQRERPSWQVLQQILAVPGRVPSPAEVPCHAGVRQTVAEMRRAPHRRL